jgi:biopolymer transport protein ExbD
MRIRENQQEEEAPVNLMPLIDMVFLLLIFFLVATSIHQEERDLKVLLPDAGPEAPLSAESNAVVINIRQDGTILVGQEKYESAQLQTLLNALGQNQPGRKVLIRADKYTYHMYPAGVLRLCREAGIHESNIGYLVSQTRITCIPRAC